ncbi:MAG: DUF3179 domain-containing protein [Alphaproteobacteria bacterium]
MTRLAALLIVLLAAPAWADPAQWKSEWPDTDFSRTAVDFKDILSGGPPKDGIPAIDDPKFVALSEVDIPGTEPVIGLVLNGEARAYPLRVLMWHEIANDTVGGVPVSVTYCPLCNAAIVFDRRVGERVLDFGTTGKLRNSDLVMYDRQTMSWWQQFQGEAIVGELLGTQLAIVPSRLESLANFAARAPDGQVLVPNNPDMRNYGLTPYAGYDLSGAPFLYRGEYPDNVMPLDRVVKVGERAWALEYVKRRGQVETDDGLRISWTPGQNSAMHEATIAEGMDVGNIVVQRRDDAGAWTDVAYGVDYAFAFHAFHPDAEIVSD